jgi:NADH-quinone oxidoreductase subunit N
MDNFRAPVIDWFLVSPYIIVAVTGILALIAELLRPKSNNNAIVGVSIVGLVLALVSLGAQIGMPAARTVNGMVVRDQFAVLMMIVMVGATLLCMLFSDAYLRQKRIAFGEFYPLTLWSLTGGMVMVGTDNLMVQFVGLEILSIALYTLAGMSRSEAKSEEAALKYFLLGALASAFFLYGTAYVYGASGTTSLYGLAKAMGSEIGPIRSMGQFALALMLVGLGFKAALVPFHQWTPDVYQGAPTNVTAFMSVVSKVAAIGALTRVLVAAAPGFETWYPVIWWVAVATMTVGNLAALAQRDVKRVLAYSSIAHAGYILVALLSHLAHPEKVSLGSVVFYLANYAVMTIGMFAVIGLTAKAGHEGTRFSDLAGLWKRAPIAAASVVVFVSSLIGVPPTGGFFAKLSIFWDAMNSGQTALALVLAVNSAVSLFYYLGIARACFVDDEPAVRAEKAPMTPGLALTCALCVAGVLGVTVLGGSVMNVTRTAGLDAAPNQLSKAEAFQERYGSSRQPRTAPRD